LISLPNVIGVRDSLLLVIVEELNMYVNSFICVWTTLTV